jgi:Fe-S cluster assembly protein SufD
MSTIDYYKERFFDLQVSEKHNALTPIKTQAIKTFGELGFPTAKNEEWKYTRISNLFSREFPMADRQISAGFSRLELENIRLPGYADANELIFVNGFFSFELSVIRSAALVVMPLEEALSGIYKDQVSRGLGQSGRYIKDGINALNTAFAQGAVFIYVNKGMVLEHPVYIYNITDARAGNIFSQPRSLVLIGENAEVMFVETYQTIGNAECFTNQVMELELEKGAVVEYYKIQNDHSNANLVSTTHFRQTGRSSLHTVSISLNGGIVRNNLHVILDATGCEAQLHGLYFINGSTHIDNHTIVDNLKPNCTTNELYKGVMNGEASGVFNGKIFVRPLAQKTNAYQSNKNILLSEDATMNSKPQLEIFADDVRCSHGCTVGRLDEEALFYLRSRGLSEKKARFLLVRAFAEDILDHIKPLSIRTLVEGLISEQLESGQS